MFKSRSIKNESATYIIQTSTQLKEFTFSIKIGQNIDNKSKIELELLQREMFYRLDIEIDWEKVKQIKTELFLIQTRLNDLKFIKKENNSSINNILFNNNQVEDIVIN